MFIKKIFEKKIDEVVHKQFTRFGRGAYTKKAVINVSIKGGKEIVISTSYELANDISEFITTLDKKIKVNGIVLSKEKNQILSKFGSEKEKARLFEYTFDKEISSEDFKKIIQESYFTLLDCKFNGGEYVVKKTLPKPGKGSEGKVNDKFCVLKLDIKFLEIVKKEFLFDLNEDLSKNFKKISCEHRYQINEIKIPDNLKNEKNPEKIRLGALRIGKIERIIIIDGKEIKKECELKA